MDKFETVRDDMADGTFGWLCATCYWYFPAGNCKDNGDGLDERREEFFGNIDDWHFDSDNSEDSQHTCMCCGQCASGIDYLPCGVK